MSSFKTFKLFFVIPVFIFMLTGSSCTKNVAGPQGDPGTPGKPGNLKQSHINPIKITSSYWSMKATTTYNYWEAVIVVSEITQDVIEKGEVKLYMENNSQWSALPFSDHYIFTQYSIEKGLIRLNCSHIHGGTPTKPLDTNYRIVIFSPA